MALAPAGRTTGSFPVGGTIDAATAASFDSPTLDPNRTGLRTDFEATRAAAAATAHTTQSHVVNRQAGRYHGGHTGVHMEQGVPANTAWRDAHKEWEYLQHVQPQADKRFEAAAEQTTRSTRFKTGFFRKPQDAIR